VASPPQRNRLDFELSRAIAQAISEDFEPGMPNSEFIFYMTQYIYSSEVRTGDPRDGDD
jgi:hypothetical protein